jgi:hypothetical protein
MFGFKKKRIAEKVKVPAGTRYYGSDMTIHSGGEVDVEVDSDGKVVAVWFRCQPLPFDQRMVQELRAKEMRSMYKWGFAGRIEAVVMRDV